MEIILPAGHHQAPVQHQCNGAELLSLRTELQRSLVTTQWTPTICLAAACTAFSNGEYIGIRYPNQREDILWHFQHGGGPNAQNTAFTVMLDRGWDNYVLIDIQELMVSDIPNLTALHTTIWEHVSYMLNAGFLFHTDLTAQFPKLVINKNRVALIEDLRDPRWAAIA